MDMENALASLEEVYGAFGEKDAVSQQEIDAAGQRLGLVLPRALQVLYRRTGRSVSLHQSNDVLVLPRDLVIEDGHLIFYNENQRVCRWGIAVSSLVLDDPPVHTSYLGTSGEQWMLEAASVTEFIRVHGSWQAVQGGLPVVGVVSGASIAGVSTSKSGLGRKVREAASHAASPFVVTKTTSAWIIQGCVLAMASDEHFGLAAREAEPFCQVAGQLGMTLDDWDYASLRERTPNRRDAQM